MQKYEVINLTPLNNSSYLLTLKNLSKKEFYWSAGQYMAVHFDRRGRKTPVRCFSIVGDPNERQVISLAIKKTGKFTRALNNIKPGQIVYVQGPFGDFLLPDRADIPLVFFAGGIGITPFISMLLDLTSLSESNPVKLYYACRAPEDLAFIDLLESVLRSKKNVQVEVVLKSGNLKTSNSITQSSGVIDKTFVEKVVTESPNNSMFYLCGPAGFMNGISSNLVKQGVYEDNIVIEAFGQRNLVSAQERFPVNKKIYAASALGLILGFGILSSGSITKALKSELKEHEGTQTQSGSFDDSSSNTQSPGAQTGTNDTTSQSTTDNSTQTYTDTNNTYTSPSTSSTQQQTYSTPMSGAS